MKIRITEEQAKRLKLLKEETDPLVQYEQLCSRLIIEINKIYAKVTSIMISEVLNQSVNMEEINNHLDKIDNMSTVGQTRAYNYINNLLESDLDIRIDNAHSSVSERLTSLQLIVMDLERLQKSSKEHDLTSQFRDVKPMDIN